MSYIYYRPKVIEFTFIHLLLILVRRKWPSVKVVLQDHKIHILLDILLFSDITEKEDYRDIFLSSSLSIDTTRNGKMEEKHNTDETVQLQYL